MTELDIMKRAKMYMDKLAQGVDPITDQNMPGDSVLNQVRLARCFFYVSDVLEQVIANGGVVGQKPKTPKFSITPEQLRGVRVSPEPVCITQLVDMIAAAAGNGQMKKLRTTVITDWMLTEGYMEKRQGADGKHVRVPTEKGIQLGISVQARRSPQGEYMAVYYDAKAQQFILDHLEAMLAAKTSYRNMDLAGSHDRGENRDGAIEYVADTDDLEAEFGEF